MNEDILKTVNNKWLMMRFIEEVRAKRDLQLILQLEKEIMDRMSKNA